MASQRETYVYIAKLAEQAGRYDEMVESMKNIAKLGVELTVEERSLLSVGYKNVVGARRASLRILSSIEEKEEGRRNEQRIKKYRQMVKDELSSICHDIINVIDEHLIPSSSASDSNVLYYTMKGDYYSYLELNEDALKAYQVASTAAADLSPTHSIRLGLALKFSVFYYEIMKSPEWACHLAKQAVDEAISELDTLSEDSYKESNSIMQLLRDNLTLWRSDNPEDGGIGVLQRELITDKPEKIILSGQECPQATKPRRERSEAAQHRVSLQDQRAQADLDKIRRAEERIRNYKNRAKHDEMIIDRKIERSRVCRSDVKKGR